MTITGGTGIDTIIMKHANDVLDAGTVTATVDTLSIVQNAVLGGFLIDLSSTTDQVTTYNGAANAAVQKGFDNADLSGVTGNFGADITARALGSTITGTANADQINGGAGNDTFIVNAGTVANSDVMTGGAGTLDTLQIATGLTYTQATDASLATVEVISLVGTAAVVLTGQTEAFTINGGAGSNAITGGTGNDTIALTVDGAVDTINVRTTTGFETITSFLVGAGGDVIAGNISTGGAPATPVSSADAGTALTVASTDEVVILRTADNATFADLAAVRTRLAAGAESFAASDQFYIVYSNAAGVTNIAILTTDAGNTDITAADTLVDVVTLTGSVNSALLLAANFANLA